MAASGSFCKPCLRGGTHVESSMFCSDCDEHVCDSCTKIHRKIKSLASHVIYDENSVTEESGDWKTTTTNMACPDHPENLAEYFCTQCIEMCCEQCFSDDHSQCNPEPVHFPDISNFLPTATDGQNSETTPTEKECEKIRDGLDILKQAYDTVKSRLQADISESRKKHADTEAMLKEISENGNELFKMAVDYMGTVVDELSDEAKAVFMQRQENMRQAANSIRDVRAAIETASNSGNQGPLIDAIKTVNTQIEELRNSTTCESKVDYEKSLTIATELVVGFFEMIFSLGKDGDNADASVTCKNMGMKTWLDGIQHEILVSGLIVTYPYIIFADRSNRKLKMMDTRRDLKWEFPLHSLFAT